MQLNPYLHFPGTCADALAFYEKVLGAQVLSQFKFADSPMADKMPADWRDKLMHSAFKISDTTLFACDAPPDHFSKPQGFSLNIPANSGAEAKKLYDTLSEGGEITMPLQKTFWAAHFAMFKDKFGIPWMINCEKE